jgi:hypothetical protein
MWFRDRARIEGLTICHGIDQAVELSAVHRNREVGP